VTKLATLCSTVGVLGLAVGGGALLRAGSDDQVAAVGETQRDTIPWPTMLPATSGSETPQFSLTVSAAEAGGSDASRADFTIRLLALGSRTCYEAFLPSGTRSTACFHAETVRTGFAYAAYQDHGGPITIIGVVPDDVTSIEIAGTSITPANNVWTYVAATGDDLAFTVVGSDGQRATLGQS
jgi:hypothetical protein